MFRKKLKPELFRRMRDNAELSREELALLMDWSEGTVVNYETKECKMDLYEFEKFMMVTTTSKEDREARKKLLKHISDAMQELATIGDNTAKS
ncbi:helix-turn-helix domain-containing protein [Alteromonas sp. ASW11-130]|uniref:helix-turn-helix domain-containing protein n=1 Tax=Alteromonas sp. ASW11-130 TaxID=3015775 RepID=UPI002242ADE3|nr:helix-turn-helix transcriptional regulator [Alteromonas sp. ASW11-130]MCW8092480.1 helix-turn-helix domain-containing protein [Alteromonas sp. ASW11-130]